VSLGYLQEFEWYHQEGRKAYEAKNYTQACRLLEHALTGRERLLGSDARETAETRKYFAQSLFMAEQPKEAVKHFTSLVGFSERAFGSNDAETLRRRMSLGEALERCGGADLPAASEQFSLAACGWESTVGPDTEEALHCRYKAGLGYSKGEPFSLTWPYWTAAEENLQRAAEGWKRIRGARDDKSLQALIAYASVLLHMQDDDKALQLFKSARDITKAKRLPKSHAQVIAVKKGIEDCKFWINEGLPVDRQEMARRREAKAYRDRNWRELSGWG
jgi:tetratricopeptide (TPR) repeat protein